MRLPIPLLCAALALTAPLGAMDSDGALTEAIGLIDEGEYTTAKRTLERLDQRLPGRADIAFQMGRALYLEGNAETSVEWLERAIERQHGVSEYHQWLGRSYATLVQQASVFKKMSLAGKSREAFEKAVQLDGDNVEARADLIDYYLEAPAIAGGSVEKALAQAVEIRRRDPYQGHLSTARIHEHEDELDEAEKAYLAAVAVETDDHGARYRLGYLYQGQERWKEAYATFEALAKIEGEKMGASYQIGRTGSLSGTNLERAAEALRVYLTHDPAANEPSLAWAHFRLAQVYDQMGSAADAKRELESALRLDPEHEEAQKALKRLK